MNPKKRIKWVEEQIDRLAYGRHADADTYSLINWIDWLYHYKHLPKQDLDRLSDKMIYILDVEKFHMGKLSKCPESPYYP